MVLAAFPLTVRPPQPLRLWPELLRVRKSCVVWQSLPWVRLCRGPGGAGGADLRGSATWPGPQASASWGASVPPVYPLGPEPGNPRKNLQGPHRSSGSVCGAGGVSSPLCPVPWMEAAFIVPAGSLPRLPFDSSVSVASRAVLSREASEADVRPGAAGLVPRGWAARRGVRVTLRARALAAQRGWAALFLDGPRLRTGGGRGDASGPPGRPACPDAFTARASVSFPRLQPSSSGGRVFLVKAPLFLPCCSCKRGSLRPVS